jgi:hypothetical protein
MFSLGFMKKFQVLIPPLLFMRSKPTLGVKPVRQETLPVHPRKTTTIKVEVEKLLKARFIYPVPLTDWVSNIVPVMKK